MTACNVSGCDRPHRAKGMCRRHYYRWKKHGDPLVVKTPPKGGPAQSFLRDVALLSGGDECVIWPFSKTRGGYPTVYHEGRTQLVCRIVCTEVYGPAPSDDHEAAHGPQCGGNRACVNGDHLRWATHAENMADTVTDGTSSRGERHHKTTLSNDDVREIRRLRGELSRREIADRFQVSKTVVRLIHRGDNWAWLE